MTHRIRFLSAALVIPLTAGACSSSESPQGGGPPGSDTAVGDGAAKVPSGATGPEGVPTLETRSILPTHAVEEAKGENPGNPTALAAYLQNGYGNFTFGPGEPVQARTLDGTPPPAGGKERRRLVRFAHLADLQLADDESPTRAGTVDSSGASGGALRAQDGYLCRMANAAVRTLNRIHRANPLSFVMMGGDNADSAQTNEVDWVLSILSGSDNVECDSGEDDDPVPGQDNDGKDRFRAEGLLMPWKWVTGNHDILVQGNLRVDALQQSLALGTFAALGTRNYKKPGGPVEIGPFVVADPRRSLLSRTQLMEKVASHGDGHGLTDEVRRSGKAFYTWDVPGTPLRFLALDTAAETGGAEGMLHEADLVATIKPKLDAALAERKWVILTSHHSADLLTRDGSTFGQTQADAILPDAWKLFLGQYPNVLFSFAGHSHENRVKAMVPPKGHGYWEVTTSALADYPHQFRLVEIWDEGPEWVSLRATNVDFDTENDPVAAEGRRFGIAEYTSGWVPRSSPGTPLDRNVVLWMKKPF